MKIGVRAHDFGRMDENVLAKTIKEAGFEAVQLALTKAIEGIDGFGDITMARVDSIREAFAANNLEINVLGCYIEPSLLDREKRLCQVGHFIKGIEYAKAMGVSIIGTETTNFNPANEALREETYGYLKDSVLRMVEKAEKEGITIGIEPVAEHTLNTSELSLRLIEEVNSSKLKIIFDPVNMLLPHTVGEQRQIYRRFFEQIGDHIVAVHMKDIVIENNEKTWRNIGSGIVDYEYIFKWLKANKPDICLLREHVRMDSYRVDYEKMAELIN